MGVKISVIMPMLNSEPFIRECLDSVVNQTCKELEIICVDAGSTDGTLDILQEYAGKDNRIKIIHSDEKSYGYQMNIGIQMATGEYIGIVESDDYILPHMYEKLYLKAKQFDLDVIKADYYYVTGTGNSEKKEYFHIVTPELYGKVLNPKEETRCVTFMITCSGICKRSFLSSNKIKYNETPGASYQDNGFYFQTHCCAEKMYFLNEPLYCYRRDNPNSSIHHPGKIFLICDEYEFIYNFLKNSPDLYNAFIKRYCWNMFYAYLAAYRRVAEEFKLQFLKRFSLDFNTLNERGELYPEVWDKKSQQLLRSIMQAPETFYFNDRAPQYLQAQLRGSAENNSGTALRMEVGRLNNEIANIHMSWAYRIGRFITFVPRKVRGGIRCYQEHGLRYTLLRIPQKFSALWKRWKKRPRRTAKKLIPANVPVVKADNRPPLGCSTKRHTPELIVSLTSFPARIGTVHKTIDTILRQTERPDRVILWLAKEQFPSRKKKLPKELLALQKYGLEIRWCHDIKSYKKLIPTLKEYPQAIIVTADDDVYYAPNWLELLYVSYQKWPNFVHVHRDTCFYLENGEWKWIPGGRKAYPCPSYLHKLVGIGGVLYPPHCLHPDVIREDLFTKLDKTNDDIWFWLMAVRNNCKILVVNHCQPGPKYVEGTQEGECLTKINDLGPKLFLRDFNNFLDFYPEVRAALEKDYAFVTSFEKYHAIKKKDYSYYENLPADKYEVELVSWFQRTTREWLNLDDPKTFNEKMQWLKLYDNTPIKTRLADKYLVRDWIKEKIGEEYLIPLLGVWDSFDEINFDKLPEQFVLKTNHGCGWNIIVKDKSKLDIADARKKFNTWLQTNYAFRWGFELHYMNIPPKIIAEEYIEQIDQVYDYKFMCFGGKVKFIWVDTDRFTKHKRTLFTREWERMHATIGKYPPADYDIPCPNNLKKMISLAELLGQIFVHARIDFYEVSGQLYFGEITFTSGSGIEKVSPAEFEYKMGSWIQLPPKSPLPERLF